MIKRQLKTTIRKTSQGFPIIGIIGPRQSGKTTLTQDLFPKYTYVNLETPHLRRQASEDPVNFLERYDKFVIFDEIQNVPELFSYLQVKTDHDKILNQYIITGSQHFLLMKAISQSLAGRIILYTLLPLSCDELKENKKNLKLHELIFRGSYPRLYATTIDQSAWSSSYIQTYLERDLRQLINVSSLTIFEKFLRLLAGRTGQLLNYASLASDVGVTQNTIKAWVSLLQTSFIVYPLIPHYKNFNKRLIKSPKIYFYDTGILCWLLGIDNEKQLSSHYLYGSIFENWIINEYQKYSFNHGNQPRGYFWRDQHGHEIDLLIEHNSRIYPIEIKSGKTESEDYFDGLRYYQSLAQNNLNTLVYGGEDTYKSKYGQVVSWHNFTAYLKSKL